MPSETSLLRGRHGAVALVIGAGPAGLMAAQVLAERGASVHVLDAMPSAGRKFLLAGKGGLNLSHSEPVALFVQRYGVHAGKIQPWIEKFGAHQVMHWAQSLGIETFTGTSGRIFPVGMKATPLLRAWLRALYAKGVHFHMRHRWEGWQVEGLDAPTHLQFSTPDGHKVLKADAVVLALGGASWSRLGSDGAWVPWLHAKGLATAPLQPSNCGFDVPAWTEHFKTKFAGAAFKLVSIRFTNSQGVEFQRTGEFVVTRMGVEGSLIYAVSSMLRDEIAKKGDAIFHLDLLPRIPYAQVRAAVNHPRGARSLSNHLQSRLQLNGVKRAILYEIVPKEAMAQPEILAQMIKNLPIRLIAPRPIEEAISTAGGVSFKELNSQLMLRNLPGVFAPAKCSIGKHQQAVIC